MNRIVKKTGEGLKQCPVVTIIDATKTIVVTVIIEKVTLPIRHRVTGKTKINTLKTWFTCIIKYHEAN